MDCFFKDPRLLKQQQQQQKQTTTQQQQQQQQIRIKTLQSTQQPLPKRIKLNHQQQTATKQTTTTTTKKTIHSKPQLNNTQQSNQLSKTRETKPLVNETEDNHHKTQEINNNNTTQDINQTQVINKTQNNNKTQDINTTQDIKKTQDKQPQDDQNQTNKNQTTNHQDYQLHPIIPRSVDKTITAYSSNHPLNVEPAERKLTSSAKLVNANRNQFKPWFTNQDPQRWPFKKNQDPQIRVVYPTGAHELFPLLVPKNDLDEYRPLDDLLNPTERLQLPEPTIAGAVLAGARTIDDAQDPALGRIVRSELEAALERACEDDPTEERAGVSGTGWLVQSGDQVSGRRERDRPTDRLVCGDAAGGLGDDFGPSV
ncbi:Nucleosomal histone H3-Lys79 methylase [Puccinia graminis f. sp. tritici]|uniref:Nucleosomal histone H3-Lys79 methylase n=1 Tax=Puccinia graminis f. sp. tritici TaxID=56615 RepID=A0A5B0MCG5_PUCGR|nr:Nucleosomal histone H3-Lys79 methylase [Puccinia graminis f. sp. tritici]